MEFFLGARIISINVGQSLCEISFDWTPGQANTPLDMKEKEQQLEEMDRSMDKVNWPQKPWSNVPVLWESNSLSPWSMQNNMPSHVKIKWVEMGWKDWLTDYNERLGLCRNQRVSDSLGIEVLQ